MEMERKAMLICRSLSPCVCSNASRVSAEVGAEDAEGGHQGQGQPKENDVPAFKVAMLGAAGVGKTTLTYQFTTSEYICAYDLSLGKCENETFRIRVHNLKWLEGGAEAEVERQRQRLWLWSLIKCICILIMPQNS